ncbi:MAG: type II toxin-antitoxin system RelE/ParE family toxin [Candidatus Humimicrobiia bacterium]
MAYKILYKASVKRDLKKIPKLEVKRILNKKENDLGKNPNKGELLKGKFQGLYQYRVGVYQVIYVKTVDGGVLVLKISHRKD